MNVNDIYNGISPIIPAWRMAKVGAQFSSGGWVSKSHFPIFLTGLQWLVHAREAEKKMVKYEAVMVLVVVMALVVMVIVILLMLVVFDDYGVGGGDDGVGGDDHEIDDDCNDDDGCA